MLMLYTVTFTSVSYEPTFPLFLSTVHKFNNDTNNYISLESGLPAFLLHQALRFVHVILNIANTV